MEYNLEKFRLGLKDLGIVLSEEQENQFLQYYEMLVEKNKVMNLTNIVDFEDVVSKHFLDSLSLVKVVDLKKPSQVLDIGTGAGFPGIPLKIAFPELEVTLMDSTNKKISFTKEVIEALGLKKIKAIHGRAEELTKKPEYKNRYDLVVSRAVAKLSLLSKYCLPFVKKQGCFISYKGTNITEELTEAKGTINRQGGKLESIEEFNIPNTEINRTLIKIRKCFT
jgi:16S rRNA (guanine527-N7)-methyltransferase